MFVIKTLHINPGANRSRLKPVSTAVIWVIADDSIAIEDQSLMWAGVEGFLTSGNSKHWI